MKSIKTPIIPIHKTIVDTPGEATLDLEAICLFVAFGFFFDCDTYWKNKKVLTPGTNYKIAGDNSVISSSKWFSWHYSPKDISFEKTLEEFTELFETIVKEQTQNKHVILPISGGLDSRTQAVALRNHPSVKAYSYDYAGGFPETKIAKKIADACNFPFQSLSVSKGYLWNCIEELATINSCYSEFTHPRQMAFIKEFKQMGNVFSLGHMGDLMFDSFGLPNLTFNEEVEVLTKMLLKKGGYDLGNSLWESWGLAGTFKAYYTNRICELLEKIKIENNTNARLRAFKTQYYVSRWSSNNLSVFQKEHPVTLPYYDDRMCAFICTIPEKYLANRQLQIAYIKQQAPDLAKITWQGQKPFNLHNFQLNKVPYNIPYRIAGKIKRELNGLLGKPYISRNWELQFVGKENDANLKKWLFDSQLENLVPKSTIQAFYKNFKEKDAVKYSHPVSMLLTLALFQEKFNTK
ncbi:MAG: asparagine synthase-related protein [Oceanihabitans sp.]